MTNNFKTKLSIMVSIVILSQSENMCNPSDNCTITSSSITCNADSCDIQCNSCFGWQIFCDQGTLCSISCNGNSVCQRLQIDATKAQLLSITASGRWSMFNARIKCPDDGAGTF
eukprot:227543_1